MAERFAPSRSRGGGRNGNRPNSREIPSSSSPAKFYDGNGDEFRKSDRNQRKKMRGSRNGTTNGFNSFRQTHNSNEERDDLREEPFVNQFGPPQRDYEFRSGHENNYESNLNSFRREPDFDFRSSRNNPIESFNDFHRHDPIRSPRAHGSRDFQIYNRFEQNDRHERHHYPEDNCFSSYVSNQNTKHSGGQMNGFSRFEHERGPHYEADGDVRCERIGSSRREKRDIVSPVKTETNEIKLKQLKEELEIANEDVRKCKFELERAEIRKRSVEKKYKEEVLKQEDRRSVNTINNLRSARHEEVLDIEYGQHIPMVNVAMVNAIVEDNSNEMLSMPPEVLTKNRQTTPNEDNRRQSPSSKQVKNVQENSKVQAHESQDSKMIPIKEQFKKLSVQGSSTSPNSNKKDVTPFPEPPIIEPLSSAVLAEKLEPAKITNANRIEVLTNFWDIDVENKIVYRYDVVVTAVLGSDPTLQKLVPLSSGPRGDASQIERSKICLAALRAGLEAYGRFRNQIGSVYDCATQLYTSEQLPAEGKPGTTIQLTVNVQSLPREVQETIRYPDVNHFDITISPNTACPSFNVGDFSKESNRKLSDNDKNVSNFLNLLTSQSARAKGLTVFGNGKIFDMNKPGMPIGNGQELRFGADKGIKFIEGKSNGGKKDDNRTLPALLLDSKCGAFFKSQPLEGSLQEFLKHQYRLNWDKIKRENKVGKIRDDSWITFNRYVKGLRFSTTYDRRDYTISGITPQPIGELTRDFVSENGRSVPLIDHIRMLAGPEIRINPLNPAIVVTKGKKDQKTSWYFAIETAFLMPNQRVPISKQDTPPAPIKPHERYDKIMRLMNELNLEAGGRNNEFMKMFGVKLALKPKKVDGVRRDAPSVVFKDNNALSVNANFGSWKCFDRNNSARAILSGNADLIVVGYSRANERFAKGVMDVLSRKCRDFNVNVRKWELYPIDNLDGSFANISKPLEEVAKKGNPTASMFILIEPKSVKSHEALKLAERRHLVVTLHITLENAKELPRRPATALNIVKKINVKLGGLNYRIDPEVYAREKWLSNSSILIISYDVSHPGRVDTNQPITQPSVVGFAFNGGTHPEAFVGDYHYQSPKQEQVGSEILYARTQHMLERFIHHRKSWPSHVLVIRDGVSEGQYEMVLNDEFVSIEAACKDFGVSKKKKDWRPTFALAIATKRHSARFYKAGDRNRIENVKPLTVVDRDVTRSNVNEAYIVSSHALQGTAKPVCYQLLKNENQFFKNMDEFESYLMALSFHHQINDNSICLPEPVYQADEWASRGKAVWDAFDKNFNFPKEPNGNVNFESMTEKLSYWKTNLKDRRINA